MLDKIIYTLNRLSTLFGATLTIGYAYAAFGSILGLISGILFALCELFVIWMSYHHFYKLTKSDEAEKNVYHINRLSIKELKLTKKSIIFLTIAVPCMIISTISCFIGMGKAVLLLGTATALATAPIPAAVFTCAAVIFASVAAISACLTASRVVFNSFKLLMKSEEKIISDTKKCEVTNTHKPAKTSTTVNYKPEEKLYCFKSFLSRKDERSASFNLKLKRRHSIASPEDTQFFLSAQYRPR